MKSFNGRVAAITGAGSGIGRALASALALRGAHLAVSDVDEIGLAETVAMCEGRGVKVTSYRVDVTDRDAMYAWADQVVDDHGKVNLIFNNAGVALGATVEGMSYDDFEWLMNINFWGVVHGTKAFLPHLIASGDGHVVNISSLFGLLGMPGQTAYNAAKFAVRGFTESLREEMLVARHPVQVTCVHPGGIKTAIADNAFEAALADGREVTPEDVARRKTYNEKLLKMDPDQAAKIIIDAVEAGRPRVMVGNDARVLDLLMRVIPALGPKLVLAGQKRLLR